MKMIKKLSAAIVLAVIAAATQAAPIAYEANKMPANDNWGGSVSGAVVKNGSDELCWRNNFWTPATANAQCDGAIVVQKAAPASPPAAPVPAPVVRQPITGTFTLGADGSFDLGKSVITPKGKAILDAAFIKLQAYDLQSLAISGYTDSQGNDKINIPLSKARSQSVYDYLGAKGVPTNRMTNEGYGSTNYVVEPKSCNGMKINGRSVSRTVCEAPNRRVEVKFNGLANSTN